MSRNRILTAMWSPPEAQTVREVIAPASTVEVAGAAAVDAAVVAEDAAAGAVVMAADMVATAADTEGTKLPSARNLKGSPSKLGLGGDFFIWVKKLRPGINGSGAELRNAA